MRGPHVLGLDNAPRYAYMVAAVLVLTVAYAVVQIVVVRPTLPYASQVPAGQLMQLVVFMAAACVLFLLRSSDPTAALSVLALALSAIANSGPPAGSSWPGLAGEALSGLSWISTAIAFPVIALAILYFPSKSPLLDRYPALHALPWLLAAPMLVIATARALHLWGIGGLAGIVEWAAARPALFYSSFSAALALNLACIVEGVYRYRFNHDANERRRIRMVVYTVVPGMAAYALRDGLPVVASLLGRPVQEFPSAAAALLHVLVLLPAFGLVYAVGVQRVLGPRVVLRRSLQYALASRTMTTIALLPTVPLVWMLNRDSDSTLREIATSRSGIGYLALIGLVAAGLFYRHRARAWLDAHFFREEYDARKILVSLAGRVRFETDPSDLASLVVKQIDEALHPEMAAFMVDGVQPGYMAPVSTLHRQPEVLPSDGGVMTMLRWSDQPLEIFLNDPRSPARRLPPQELEWLEQTGATLLVPVVGADRRLVGVIVLGEKRSEEAYTSDDRQLLASIAAQVGLGFDVARLRRRVEAAGGLESAATQALAAAVQPMVECPVCGRCEEAGTAVCSADNSPLYSVQGVPRVVDNKFRIEQLLGRGGMGAVYRARDVRLDRLVALKVVRPELLSDGEARQRFRREAQIVARLQHPSIVSVFDYGTFVDGGAFLVMELVRGEDLRRVLQREGRLEVDRALPILTAVCAAIDAAHREGVLHRDLKPENILLPGGGLSAKVLDFGVAKVMADVPDRDALKTGTGSLVTAAGMIIGTPAYMAPEQLHGVAPDVRSDVFSLAVVAFEMLTGELPFGRSSLAEIVMAHARGVPPFPPAAALPSGLEHALRSALDPDRAVRTPSVAAFAQQIADVGTRGRL